MRSVLISFLGKDFQGKLKCLLLEEEAAHEQHAGGMPPQRGQGDAAATPEAFAGTLWALLCHCECSWCPCLGAWSLE